MKKILVMLQSLNGIIAQNDNDNLLWGGKQDKKHFALLTKKIKLIIMGSNTFQSMKGKLLKDRKIIVMTRNPVKLCKSLKINSSKINPAQLELSTQSPEKLINNLKNQGQKKVAIAGGAKINSLFLKQNLIDEINITIAPKIFTQGKNLFDNDFQIKSNLELIKITKLDSNTLNLTYKIIK